MQKKIALVVSQFNSDITEKLLHGTLERLQERGVLKTNLTIIHVPGAVEIPLAAQLLAKTQKYAAVICLGAVIRGETNHYDYVCEQISQGCQRVMLDLSIPVIFGVLTTDTEEQAKSRVGGSHGHKGKESADAALTMLTIVEKLQQEIA
jgi:6,7-dimethyl-8-ribityllumazine synthase